MTDRKLEEKAKDPSTPSRFYESMYPDWKKVQTVLDGTDAMRAAGTTYLPQHDNESDHAYNERLAKNTLLNITKMTVESWVGRPFSDPIKFSEDPPTAVEALLSDIDLQGNNLETFCRGWFADGLAKSFSHVFVDHPRVSTPEDRARTRADDEAEGVRPYWVHLQPEEVFFADVSVENGKEVLREVRIWEEVSERVGFTEVCFPQIRRVFLADVVPEGGEEAQRVTVVELYQQEKSNKKKKRWIKVDEYQMDIDFIPMVTFYAHRDGVMHGIPPLKDLADINIAHWQSTSDQRAILTVSRFPMLAASGIPDDEDGNGEPVTVGPHRYLTTPDPNGKFYYVEPEGAAIAAGREDLHDLETQMAEYGNGFLKKKPGNMTATARALDSAEATSPLQDVTRRFADSITVALYYTARWLGLESGGKAELTTDFGPEEIDQGELTTLKDTRAKGDISREAFLLELMRRGILSEEYDIEKDAERIEAEAMQFGSAFVQDQPPQGGEAEEGGAKDAAEEGTEQEDN